MSQNQRPNRDAIDHAITTLDPTWDAARRRYQAAGGFRAPEARTWLAEAWLREARQFWRSGLPGPDFWANTELGALCSDEPESAWEMVTYLLELDRDPEVIAWLVIGEVQTVLRQHGDRIIDAVLQRARVDQEFRASLPAMHWHGFSSDVRAQLRVLPGWPDRSGVPPSPEPGAA